MTFQSWAGTCVVTVSVLDPPEMRLTVNTVSAVTSEAAGSVTVTLPLVVSANQYLLP